VSLFDPSRAKPLVPSVAPPPPPEPEPIIHDLQAIEVSNELAGLFATAKTLLNQVVTDPEVPANQRAQVLNSVTAVLERITKTRTELYNSERIRRVEQALLRVMREQPEEIRQSFLAEYERALAG
jgi:hypothetical protein